MAACLLLCAGTALAQPATTAMRRSPGFSSNPLFPCDDGDPTLDPEAPDLCTADPSVPQSIGFAVNFFGQQQDTVFINNNGNVTFDAPLFVYTPFNLTVTDRVIVAPFFADVDTRGAGSNVVTYGTDFINGHKAFAVNWDGVGYFDRGDVPLNSFQVVFIEREDVAPGDFDMEFNYETIGWDAGDLNVGIDGQAARVGFAHAPVTAFELAGSGTAATFVDSNLTTGLIHGSLGSGTLGRYFFRIRNGIVIECQDDLACDDGNPCTTDVCERDPDQLVGECKNTPVQDGVPCDDGNACTTSACQSASCQTTDEVVCEASDQCHDVGTCDPETGTCSNPERPKGTPCDDANACTQSDACNAGTCVGADPVVCEATDQCHDPGSCDTDTGICSPQTPRADGVGCDDGNACTQSDACQAGVCVGADPVVCDLADQCHDPGFCNTDTGTCTAPTPKTNGTGCDDGDACTQSDACQAGSCVGSTPVVCPAPDQCHDPGSCNPLTGTCSMPTKDDGVGCDDGNACTRSDACRAGACVGSNPVHCDAVDQCHEASICNPQTGTCSAPGTRPNGTGCNDGDPCTSGDACAAGVCAGSAVQCPDGQRCASDGQCVPETPGPCEGASDGVSCDDGDPCTEKDVCVGGTCRGAPKSCDDGNACTTDRCDAALGCVSTPAPDASSCSDDDPCTTEDACTTGECRGRRRCEVDVNPETNVSGTLRFLIVDCGIAPDEPIQRASCQATGVVAAGTTAAVRSGGTKVLDPNDFVGRVVMKSKRAKLNKRRPHVVLKLKVNKLGARLLRNSTSPIDLVVRTTVELNGTRTEVDKLVKLLRR